jgi:hypothetical protein
MIQLDQAANRDLFRADLMRSAKQVRREAKDFLAQAPQPPEGSQAPEDSQTHKVLQNSPSPKTP